MKDEKTSWNTYWLINNRLKWMADLYRKLFLAGPMSHMVEKYFKSDGTFLEAGSGSATDSCYFTKKNRRMIALDISEEALKIAINQKNIDEVRLGDIRNLPFADESLDGIWNLGVMEHLSLDDIDKSLHEFKRVLKPGSKIILLWPAVYNIANMFLWWLFPAMPNLLKSKKHGIGILLKNNFRVLESKVTIVGDIILVAE